MRRERESLRGEEPVRREEKEPVRREEEEPVRRDGESVRGEKPLRGQESLRREKSMRGQEVTAFKGLPSNQETES